MRKVDGVDVAAALWVLVGFPSAAFLGPEIFGLFIGLSLFMGLFYLLAQE